MKARRVIFSLIVLVAFLAIAEGALRLFGLDRLGPHRFYQDIFNPLTLPLPGARNPYVEISEFMNRGGLRGADFPQTKPEENFRIVCLGDSTTFSATEYEESYPFLLSVYLNGAKPKKHIEVINSGIPGTSIYQQRLLFEKIFNGAGVDLLVLMTGINGREDLLVWRHRMKDPKFAVLFKANRLLANTAIYRFARRLLKGGADETVLDDSEGPESTNYTVADFRVDYVEDLNAILDLSRSWGFKVVVLAGYEMGVVEGAKEAGIKATDPDLRQKMFARGYDETLYQFATEHGWLYVDPLPKLMPLPVDTKGLWHDPGHLDWLGDRMIARELADALIKNNLVPVATKP